MSLSVVDRIRWGSDLCSWVTGNILRYVAFWVWIIDRSRAQTVPIREDFIFPVFYYRKTEQMSGWVQTVGTK